MNRKLHNTTMALIASSSLFVLGLLTATPAVTSDAPAAVIAASEATSFDADRAIVDEATGDGVEHAEAGPRRHVRRVHQQSVAMPFFSFAPRG